MLQRAWQGQRKHCALSGTSSDIKNAKLTMFSIAALSLQELLTNKGLLGVCWFLLLNNIPRAKGQE